jgi:hypothetical protein
MPCWVYSRDNPYGGMRRNIVMDKLRIIRAIPQTIRKEDIEVCPLPPPVDDSVFWDWFNYCKAEVIDAPSSTISVKI